MRFHRHHQKCLIHYFDQDQTTLLMHIIQIRILFRPKYFINGVLLTCRQNMTWMTQLTQSGFNPDTYVYGRL